MSEPLVPGSQHTAFPCAYCEALDKANDYLPPSWRELAFLQYGSQPNGPAEPDGFERDQQ